MDFDSYSAHLLQLSNRWAIALERNQYSGALVDAGINGYFYADDQQPPFHPNPHFLQWIPFDDCECSVALIVPGQATRVYWYKPKDYWYLPAEIPDWIPAHFEVREFDELDALTNEVRHEVAKLNICAYVGPDVNQWSQFAGNLESSIDLERQLNYLRAYKTEFELLSMRAATRAAVKGHVAAGHAFRDEGSEFEIHNAYLNASGQNEAALPYPNIVGLNSHAATLHYQRYDRETPAVHNSLLIDAGARSNCYNSDITRTYSANRNDEFAEIIQSLDAKQQQIVASVAIGKSFVDLHVEAHQAICEVLIQVGLLTCSAEAAYEQRLSDVFYPHGTGHLLGLQTHDVGGKTLDEFGTSGNSPERFPSLRLLRDIEDKIVFTVEPGIYFIPVLLDSIRNHPDVNWPKVARMVDFGGVRIEDNVAVSKGTATNLTRLEFARAVSPA